MWRLRPSGTSVLFAVLSVLSACGGDGTEEPTDTASTSDVSSDTTPMSDALDDTALDDTQGPIPDAVGDATDTAVPPTTCTDGVVNGAETGVDCGGGACPDCGDAQACGSDSDCASNYCEGSTCKGDVELTITAIQQDASSVDCVSEVASLVTWPDVKIRGVVTAPVRSLSGGLSGTYLGGATSAPDGGVQLVWSGGVSAAGVEPGAVVAVTGSVNEFFCNTQLVATAIEVVSDGAPPAPRVATPAEVQAEAWEGTLIRLEGVAISDSSTVGSGYVTLAGGLQLQLGDFGVTVEEGTAALAWVVGVVKYSFGDYRVAVIEVGLVADPCSPSPCLNGASCDDSGGVAMCTCVAGYEGETCETNIDDCDPNPCAAAAACADGVNAFSCAGDTCSNPRTATAVNVFRWAGAGDLAAPGIANDYEPTGCAQLGTFPVNAAGSGRDEVWSFTAIEAGTYRAIVTPTGNVDLALHTYPGDGCASACYGYSDSGYSGVAEFIDLPDLVLGEVVSVVVDAWGAGTFGAYDIRIERIGCAGGECRVQAAGTVGLPTRLTVGGDGLPLWLVSSGANAEKVVRCDSPYCASGLPTERTFTGVDSSSVAASPGTDGTAFYAYGGTDFELYMYTCTAPCTNWDTVITSDGSTNADDRFFYPAVAVTADGVPKLAFLKGTGSASQLLQFWGGPGTDPVLIDATVAAMKPKVAVGDDGLAVILYWDTTDEATLVHCADAGCTSMTTQIIATQTMNGASLAIGANGFPLMAQKTGYSFSSDTYGGFGFFACADATCATGSATFGSIGAGGAAISPYYDPTIAVSAAGREYYAYQRGDSTIGMFQCVDACGAPGDDVVLSIAHVNGVGGAGQALPAYSEGLAVGLDGGALLLYRPTSGGAMLRHVKPLVP